MGKDSYRNQDDGDHRNQDVCGVGVFMLVGMLLMSCGV